MVYLVFKRSEREVRERAHEAAPAWARGKVNGYCRGLEEADRIQVGRGRDNPNAGLMLVDDVTAAESTARTRRRVMKAATGVDFE